MAAILKNRYDVITPPITTKQVVAKWHADDTIYVKIETGNRIPTWGHLFSETGTSFISAMD